jgi:hypothetical protein
MNNEYDFITRAIREYKSQSFDKYPDLTLQGSRAKVIYNTDSVDVLLLTPSKNEEPETIIYHTEFSL